MANQILVSIFDHAVGVYAPAMCVPAEAAAIRSFQSEIRRVDPDNLLHTNKEDFTLYRVGEFDLDSGSVITNDPRVLIHGRDVMHFVLPAPDASGSYGGTSVG